MPRFSLTQLMMAIALLAILLTLMQAEGCGERYTLVECVSFSPSGSRLIASRLDARDARTPGKGYKADVSRTISVMDATDGSNARVLNQEIRRGNQGPAFGLWRYNRTSVAFVSDDLAVAHGFGGGPLAVYTIDGQDRSARTLKFPDHPVFNVGASHRGSLVAASDMGGVSVMQVADDSVIRTIRAPELPFLDASLVSFSSDDAYLAVGNLDGVQILDLTAAEGVAGKIVTKDEMLEAIALLPDGSVVIASRGLRLYDASGKMIRSFSTKGGYIACAASRDGRRIAGSTGHHVEVYDVESGKRLQQYNFDFASCLAFAGSTLNLAIGDGKGNLSLVDTVSGSTLWITKVPGRYRWPWTAPGAVILVWLYFAYRLSKKRG